jgi:aarF domain-containing kinase
MGGKRILDLAALFNASCGVAEKHIALRRRQLDVYNRTSTIAKAVRSQTDRVTETAKAASFIVSRLNESAPEWASEARDDEPTRQTNAAHNARRTTSSTETDIPQNTDSQRPTSLNESSVQATIGSTLSTNAAKTSHQQFEFQIPSRTADGVDESAVDPLVKGHDEDIFYQKSGHTSPSSSSLPRLKIPLHPSSSQGSGIGFSRRINSDLFYNNEESQQQDSSADTAPKQKQAPEGINTDLFRSRRVAKVLGANIQGGVVE